MNYSILELDDFECAPDEPHRKFAALEQAARRRMNNIIEAAESSSVASDLRGQYMTLMVNIASTLGIPGVTYPVGHFSNEWDEHQAFSLTVQSAIARIMLDSNLVKGVNSVRLASTTKAKIEGQLSNLRRLIENLEIPAARKAKLISQLDDFGAELNRPRLNYASIAMVATVILANVQGVTSTLADAPNAYQTVGTILKWIGLDKEAEENEQKRLGLNLEMLPTPRMPPQVETSVNDVCDDLDDDIPF